MRHIRKYDNFGESIEDEYMRLVNDDPVPNGEWTKKDHSRFDKKARRLKELVKDYAKLKGYDTGPVYHGTDASFNEFDPNKASFLFRDDNQMKFFFAFDKKNAEPPSMKKPKRIIEAYLRCTVEGTYGEDKSGEDVLVPKNADYVQLGTLHISVKYPEQIKLADPITYDDKGQLIPLSKRFNRKSKDIRY